MTLDEFLAQWHDADDRLLVHTSGSTGRPKPLWVEKRRMEASARVTCDFLGLRPGDTALLCLPLDYIAGKMVVVRSLVRGLRLLEVGASGHPLAHVGPGERIDFAAMVPSQVYNSLQVPAECDLLRSVGHLIIGGGAVDGEMAARLRDFPHAVWSTYGMTETLSHIALRRLNGAEASEWYTPFEGVDVTTTGDGCLVIDAPGVAERRLVTNDRVEIAGDGRRFKVLGRKDNVIDSGGVKIQIEEVEKALKPCLAMPFAVTKRPHPKWGEAVVLVYVAADGDGVAAEDVRQVCESCLPKYWRPQHYLRVSAIPMTDTGKPARGRIEEMAR